MRVFQLIFCNYFLNDQQNHLHRITVSVASANPHDKLIQMLPKLNLSV